MAGKKRKHATLTAEDHARFEETSRVLWERIAYHAAKAGEEERARGNRRNASFWTERSKRAASRARAIAAGGVSRSEERWWREQTSQMVGERIAYHQAKAREEEAAAKAEYGE
jgi:hypothetical protein